MQASGVMTMNKKGTNIAKGIAIILMLWHHAFYSAKSVAERVGEASFSYSPFSPSTVFSIAKAGKICVPIFVFITGYGTYLSLKKRKATQNDGSYLARYAGAHHLGLLMQFLPVFILGVGACVITGTQGLREVYGGDGPVAALFYLLIDALGLAKVFGTPTFNGSWWYLSLAILLIYLMPVLISFSDAFGSWTLLLVVCLAPSLMGLDMSTNLLRYLPAAVLGIMFAQYHVFEASLRADEKITPWLTTMLLVAAAVAAILLQKMLGRPWLFHSLGAALICLIAQRIERLGGNVLAFLGKHSSNMFMCHTFYFAVLLPHQLYGLGHWLLTLGALIALSLLTSVLLELAKDATGYSALRQRLVGAIQERSA